MYLAEFVYRVIACGFLATAVIGVPGDTFRQGRYEYDDDYSNVSTNDEDIQTTSPKKVDAHGSWMTFVQHSDRMRDKRKGKTKKKRKTLYGPPGPAGPPGPPGPKGALITKEVMLEEFKDIVREVAEKRAEKVLSDKCSHCALYANETTVLPPTRDLDEMFIVPRITSACHVRLRNNIVVASRTFMELKNFHQPFGGGAFQRGNVFDSRAGRFTAPRDGIYQFSANLHLAQKSKNRRQRKMKKRDNVKILVCIDSLCQKYTSLEYTTGLESNSKVFTVSINGLLQLQKGQYTSVYVDNSSKWAVTIQSASDFTGILLGV